MPAPEPEPTPAPPPKKASPAPKPVEKAKPKPSPTKKAEPEKVKEKPKTDKRPRGSRLGSDFLKGIETERPTKSTSTTPPAEKMSSHQVASRPEARRLGKACSSTCRPRCAPYHKTKTKSKR